MHCTVYTVGSIVYACLPNDNWIQSWLNMYAFTYTVHCTLYRYTEMQYTVYMVAPCSLLDTLSDLVSTWYWIQSWLNMNTFKRKGNIEGSLMRTGVWQVWIVRNAAIRLCKNAQWAERKKYLFSIITRTKSRSLHWQKGKKYIKSMVIKPGTVITRKLSNRTLTPYLWLWIVQWTWRTTIVQCKQTHFTK